MRRVRPGFSAGCPAAVDPTVASRGSRIVRTTGDGVLLEFPSIVAAVERAVAVQEPKAERDSDVAEDRRILFRIGIQGCAATPCQALDRRPAIQEDER